ncbi:MAG: DUF1592 domain-containing protein [Myxococcales bacterium FL481]|nr:MAG: DUF1592 domain-containing protein [Myxococcales bacterium FL481]
MGWSVSRRRLIARRVRGRFAPRIQDWRWMASLLAGALACGGAQSELDTTEGLDDGSAPSATSNDESEAADDEASDDESPSPDGDSTDCEDIQVRAPLRRLTRFEYSNTIRDLFADDTQPGNKLPSEELGNGFGNDAESMSASSLLVEQYGNVGEEIGQRAVANKDVLERFAPCAHDVALTDEAECAATFVNNLAPLAYRRPLTDAEIAELLDLHHRLRQDSADFATSLVALIEVVLHSPEFLYRFEWGDGSAEDKPRRLSGFETATRLAFLFWGTAPTKELLQQAADGGLDDDDEVRSTAERMIDDPRSRSTLRFFFDHFLPISSLAQLERDDELFPTFHAAVGAAMREEIHQLLEYEIFDGPGTWAHALTAPYTFVNGELADFYGISGVDGEAFQRVDWDDEPRRGILTSAGLMAGTTHANFTSPVIRGSYIVQRLMCIEVPPPPADLEDEIKPPDPAEGGTARDRYEQHSEDPACASCHVLMDAPGFALENYDAVGLWRDRENGFEIDPEVDMVGVGQVDGPLALGEALAASELVDACFARNWGNFAYGLTMGEQDECLRLDVERAFARADGDIRQFLVELTQTDAFRYLPPREAQP